MLNKRSLLKVVMFVCSMIWFGISFVSAASFTVDLDSAWIRALDMEAITKNIMPIHFADNWNDFGWFLYINSHEVILTGDEVLNAADETFWYSWFRVVNFSGDLFWNICGLQVKWFYYNSERWERLWPIDEGTAVSWRGLNGGPDLQPWLTTNGWLFTSCYNKDIESALGECGGMEVGDVSQCEVEKMEEYWILYGYYWSVIHEYSWKTFGLIAGTQYTGLEAPWLFIDGTTWLSENFIRYDNKYPVGLVYDYNWWVWFVGCEFMWDKTLWLRTLVTKLISWQKLDELFTEDTENHTIMYSGLDIPLNCSGVGSVENSLIKMVVDGLVWLGWVSPTVISSITNNTSDAKMQIFASANINNASLINYAKKRAEIICRWKWETYTDTTTIKALNCINGINNETDTINAQLGKTYIVKNWNVKVEVMDDFNNTGYYNIFIDWGNLLLDNEDLSSHKKVFKKDGFISNTTKSDYITNIGTTLSTYSGDDVAVWVFIKWNFIVNWMLESSNSDKINSRYFVYWKLTTTDSLTDIVWNNGIFSRYCTNWISTDVDEYYCPQARSDWSNPYTNSALIVIDQNYNSPLFNS